MQTESGSLNVKDPNQGKTGQAKTVERKGMCKTGMCDCRGDAQHGNRPRWKEETDCAFAEQNLYFFIIILYFVFSLFVCIELNFRIAESW